MIGQPNDHWWGYDNLPSGEPYDWGDAARTDNPDDQIDYHLDLGCGRVKKARLGIDHFDDPGVDLLMDLNTLHLAGYGERPWELSENPAEGLIPIDGRLPFPAASINGIITHHCFEHIGPGFIRLMDECHRVMVPGSKLRIIVPLFPSHSSVADPDHVRNFVPHTFKPFLGAPDGSSWMESFSTPYSLARFEEGEVDETARNPDPTVWWTPDDAREMRITLRKYDLEEKV